MGPVTSTAVEDALAASTVSVNEDPPSKTGNDAETGESFKVDGPYSRLLGDTEHNWCRAVASGTGITVLALLFARSVASADLQAAIDAIQLQHPRLRSQLLWINGKPAFQVSEHPQVKIEILNTVDSPLSCWTQKVEDDSADSVTCETEELEPGYTAKENQSPADTVTSQLSAVQESPNISFSPTNDWLSYVERELNTNLWPEHEHCLEPVHMFAVRLFLLPKSRSLVVLRLHTATCDRASAPIIVTDILTFLHEHKKDHQNSHPLPDTRESYTTSHATDLGPLMSIEDSIPPGKANKPFWAHGIDMLGYSLGSKRHAFLPFEDHDSPRRSEIVHASLSVQHTQLLTEKCTNAKTSIYGALCAAGLKATAAFKRLGTQSEHFAVISLVDCRRHLQPELSHTTVGFYNSAVLNTHHLNETTEFWELAIRCTSALDNAIKNRKHFTDMGDLNFLMLQAIRHPNWTLQSSLRTSLLVLFKDIVADGASGLCEAVGVEDYVGCSSVHGVGPSLAIFDSMRMGALHFTGVYAAPLHSRSQIEKLVGLMINILLHSLEK